MVKKENKIRKLLQKSKPLMGNNRSFSNRASRRKFSGNLQTFKLGSKNVKLTARAFRSILKIVSA